jgi:hypothetical protein
MLSAVGCQLTDYRMMVIFLIFDSIGNQTTGSPHEYWWPKLRCRSSAFQDLDCAELLGI